MKVSAGIWIPLLVAGSVLAQSIRLGVSHRAEGEALRLAWYAQRDTADLTGDTTATLPGRDTTTALPAPDSLDFEEELGGFEEEEVQILARDTMQVPDSLRTVDPWLFKYYIAVKDSLTHAEVTDSLRRSYLALQDSVAARREAGDSLGILRDSLLARADSLDWRRVDSTYLADSTATAIRKFNEWYASLTTKEQKRYQKDLAVKAKMRRIDSLMQVKLKELEVKDSLRAIRDSIRESTPRILSTYAVPDSMHFKRIFTWTHDPYFNKLDIHELDTTYNHFFFDEPFYRKDVNVTYLGVIGSAVQTYDFMKRNSESGVSFYEPYEVYSYSPATLPMYNTKNPYTELSYHGTLFANKEKEEDNIRIFTTQNIFPSLNIALEYKRYGSGGMLLKENTINKTFVASANYLGERYVAHGGYIYNRIKRTENGGIVDNFWIRDTTVDTREINIHLLSAKNVVTKRTVFFDQSYRIPMRFLIRDSVKRAKADSLDADGTTAFIGTSSEFSVYHKLYTDEISDENGRALYNNTFYLNPKTSFDSLRVMQFDNRAYVRLQPWSAEAVVSKIEGGIGDRVRSFYLFTPESYLVKPENTRWNSLYTYAGAEGQISKAVWWNGFGKLNLAGDEAGDFLVKGEAGFRFYPFRRARSSAVSFRAGIETSLQRPDYYAEHFFSNHYRWENDFDKVSTTRLRASLDIPYWDLSLSAGYALISGQVYYDADAIARQSTHPLSVLSISAKKNFTLLDFFHFDHRGVFQVSSDEEVMPLPAAALNFRYYIQFPIVKNVLNFQFGANAWYTTKWYTPGYNPVAGTFYNQREEKYGNVPYIDLFINAQWKRACIFLKIENIGMGWPTDRRDYFSAHHYIRPAQSFKLGVHWPFYAQPGKNSTVSGRASSGMAGGRGGDSSGSSDRLSGGGSSTATGGFQTNRR